jgi:hypothetical protein
MHRFSSVAIPRPNPDPGPCPFASTEEGAARNGALRGVDFSTREVPVGQNRSQGGVLSRLYRRSRVLDRDWFRVRIDP